MNITLPINAGVAYKSFSQKARVITELWMEDQMFCPACESAHLRRTQCNTEAVDFICPDCKEPFQLKATQNVIKSKIVDGSYAAMIRAILGDKSPHLLLLQYETFNVKELILIPKFCLTSSAIEKRKPLSVSARRAGWVGCNILMDTILMDARIPVITSGKVMPAETVRNSFNALLPLSSVNSMKRGWTLDVMNAIKGLNKSIFEIADVYKLEGTLKKLHPNNENVCAKIRQQLQVLRDLGYVEFVSRGVYRWKNK